jgi:hypothetical protein
MQRESELDLLRTKWPNEEFSENGYLSIEKLVTAHVVKRDANSFEPIDQIIATGMGQPFPERMLLCMPSN